MEDWGAGRAVSEIIRSSAAGGLPAVFEAPEGMGFQELVAEVARWAGQPRNLAMGGYVDPTLTERTGLPLVEPFGDELLDLRGWGRQAHWIGCGRVGASGGERVVVVVARRADPAFTGLPEGGSWGERLCALTGWEPVPRPAVDWAAVEADLGTALPADYKEIVGLFGPGGFDDYVDLLIPGVLGMDLVVWARTAAQYSGLFEPYDCYPAPQGLLRWGSSEQELDFVWQTGVGDGPDDWPVLVGEFGAWERYDCGMGEFLVRMLADVQYGFPTCRLPGHYFRSLDSEPFED
ncbi:hypothetical protein [Streptomyces sp. NPDC127190]|uniref:hypothetical protein n=1 Tax=unclassified Streptomyces TaxID=2593676 RepID=UPI00362BD59B